MKKDVVGKHFNVWAVRAVRSARSFDEDIAVSVGFASSPAFGVKSLKFKLADTEGGVRVQA